MHIDLKAKESELGLAPERLQRAHDLIARYVERGLLPGAITLVARHGTIARLDTFGWRDIERQIPMQEDSLFRIYSMTKIVTAVAVMMIYEQGLLDVNDKVAKHLPGFTGLPVQQPDGTEIPSARDVTIYDLLRHCGGLVPGPGPDELLAEPLDLEGFAQRYATMPLLAQPGEKWNYSVSSDILARVVEVVSGQRFGDFLRERLFLPLEMPDTAFFVPDEKAERLCVCYRHGKDGRLTVQDGNGPGSSFRSPPRLQSGGAGLVSTTRDYFRFASMLLNRGRLGETSILGRKTVELMAMDHLPKEHPNLVIGTQCFRFGLGVSVMTDVAASRCLSSLGEFGWGGAAGTQVWINPREDMVVMIMIQVRAEVPTGIMDIYKRLVYQALVD